MTKETITIERRTYEVNGEKYHVLLIPENDGKVMAYYIQKDGYGVMTYYIGEPIENFNPDFADEDIKANLADMIKFAELDIECLENSN